MWWLLVRKTTREIFVLLYTQFICIYIYTSELKCILHEHKVLLYFYLHIVATPILKYFLYIAFLLFFYIEISSLELNWASIFFKIMYYFRVLLTCSYIQCIDVICPTSFNEVDTGNQDQHLAHSWFQLSSRVCC